MKQTCNNKRNARRDQRGSVIVELALMLPLMTLLRIWPPTGEPARMPVKLFAGSVPELSVPI